MQGFIVHAYTEFRRDRLYCIGRLDDGRSFAAAERRWRPYIHLYETDRGRALSLLSSLNFDSNSAALRPFSGQEALFRLDFRRYLDRSQAAALLAGAGIPSPDADTKPQDLFLMEKHIKGPVEIQGESRGGQRVDLVFPDAVLCAAAPPSRPPLILASVDIETDTRTNAIRAVGIAWTPSQSLVRVLGRGAASEKLFFHDNERSLLAAFLEDISNIDPDVLTGWNVLDFDFKIIAERCEKLALPFILGRSSDAAKYFAADSTSAEPSWRRRSAAAVVPGRQVLDALRIFRAGGRGLLGNTETGEGPADFSLQTVSQAILGEGKTEVFSSGTEKIAALEKLFAENPVLFGEYCRRDAELVLLILDKTELLKLTVERAILTGVSLDKAWTSVVSFERIYGMQLLSKGIAFQHEEQNRRVSGAAGGTVLEPLPGLFENIAVFDFRSLYPSIMRTFNIDPWTHAQCGTEAGQEDPSWIRAPNGAAFCRETGLLPGIISEYFAERRKALDAGDETAAQVYKILMNSFYGVLGTASCRYGRTELAGAITSFARKWLFFSRDWFEERSYRVLYGDTDSLFVQTGLGDEAGYGDFLDLCGNLAGELNRFLADHILSGYNLESFIELRFEKVYRRFLLPHIRGNLRVRGQKTDGEERGRAKGYGGYVLTEDGSCRVEVKGMEAVRSDSTPLARRLQVELLELVFKAGPDGEKAFMEKIRQTLRELRQGQLDKELIYRKRLSRPPESYTASTPPQVKAARLLGWKGRRGTVEYVWTKNGAEPAALPHGPLDYDHYADAQVLPVAYSIAAAAHWNAETLLPSQGRGPGTAQALTEGQIELEF